MGESTCLMHSFNGFSSTTVSTEANQGNLMPALGESVSFGRFTSESLSWEKWSTFSHKKYVEEAERYAQPGSVAQKKAFFEAHYKKIAAKKAAEEAALLEEQEKALNTNPDPESEGESCITYNTNITQYLNVDPVVELEEAVWEKKEENIAEELKNNEEFNPEVVTETDEMEKPLLKDFNSSHDTLLTKGKNKSKNNEELKSEVVTEMAEMEKPLLKDFNSSHNASPQISKKKISSPSSKALLHRKIPKIPFPPPPKYLISANNRKENNATPITESFNGNISSRKTVPKIPTSPAKFSVLTPNNKKENNPTNQSTPKLLPKTSPAKSTPFSDTKKDNNYARKTWDSPVVSTSLKNSTLKTLRTLIYSTPRKEPIVPSAKKFESLRFAPNSSKASKEWKTPSKTPQMDFAKGRMKNITTASWSENRRKTTQDTPAPGSKATRPKWHILSTVCSRPQSAHKNKLPSPTMSVPFNLRTEERAARRKQKLEEKFNEKAMPKVQLQTRIKEKAETELRKLRQSLCFRARPLPDFYKEKETPKDEIKYPKITVGNHQEPKLERKPILFPSAKSNLSLSRNSDIRSNKQKEVQNILTSLSERANYENNSPNIKH